MRSKDKKQRNAWFAGLSLLFLVVFVISFNIGKYPISPAQLGQVIFSKLLGRPQTWANEIEVVIFRIRLPRVLAAALVGAGLSAAGAAYQGLFRNPLVSPDVLGASTGAGFGAALALFFSAATFAVSLSAFFFGVLAVGIAYLVSTRARQNPALGMVLAGIMTGSLFQAATSYIKLVADPHNKLPAITYWLMGSLASTRMADVAFAAPWIIIGLAVLFMLRWKLNIMTMGEDEARSMGLNTNAVRGVVMLAATLVTAACVSISGMIGWVGLLIPHFSRMMVGHDYRTQLPASMLLGASFLLVVDCFARSLATAEIPLGILTAFLGAPFFLYLILDRGNKI